MRNFQQKRRWRRFFETPIMLGILGILALFFAYKLIYFFGKMKESGRDKELARAKVEELREGKTKLSDEIEKLNTVEGQEESIREKFGLVKEGEGVIIVVEEDAKEEEDEEGGGFWNFLKNLFK